MRQLFSYYTYTCLYYLFFSCDDIIEHGKQRFGSFRGRECGKYLCSLVTQALHCLFGIFNAAIIFGVLNQFGYVILAE